MVLLRPVLTSRVYNHQHLHDLVTNLVTNLVTSFDDYLPPTAMRYHLDKALELNPEDSVALTLLGNWYFEVSNNE